MTDVPTHDRPRSPQEAIYQEARGARRTSQQLLPLLSLLEPSDGSAPLDELKALLSDIVRILGEHSRTLDELKARLGPEAPTP